MPPTPRSSSTDGLSSQGTLLLALTGAGLAVFLIFLLPRLNASRAAGPRGSGPEAGVESTSPEQPPKLVKPVGIEPEGEEEADPGTAVAATAVVAAVQGQALVAGETRPKIEGPPLRFQRETGTKPDTVDHRELRETNRARRKERREGPTMEERAFGTEKDRAAESEKFRTRSNSDRGRLNRSGAGAKQGQGKGKSREKDQKDG